jgi:hypothetical protein
MHTTTLLALGALLQVEFINSIFARSATGGFFVPEGSNVSIRHCLFDNPAAKPIETEVGPTLRVRDQAALTARGWGSNNVLGDPGLLAPDDGDYRPAAGSLARDAAEAVPELLRDLTGGPRMLGLAADIGAQEGGCSPSRFLRSVRQIRTSGLLRLTK